jgi:RNA ligase (TIGR02306 family)
MESIAKWLATGLENQDWVKPGGSIPLLSVNSKNVVLGGEKMQRKLVSVQKIADLQPIENADFIQKAIVQGWSLVVKKGEFQVGDLCAFFEIDSVLPEKDWSEFMRPSKFRVRTKKMRGVLSQGLALPLEACLGELGRSLNLQIGDNLTDLCGVTKYEPPAGFSLDRAAAFPSFIPKTDEIRLQSAIAVLEELRGKSVYIALKYDGTSATYANLDEHFYVCSRNNELKHSQNVYWQIAEKYNLEALPDGFAVQGEICAPGIQKNRLGLKAATLFVFNVFDIRQGKYLSYSQFLEFCETYQLQPVETIRQDNSFDATLDELLALAEGFYPNTKNHREGIVIRPIVETRSDVLSDRLSIKVINNQYLLKGGDY